LLGLPLSETERKNLSLILRTLSDVLKSLREKKFTQDNQYLRKMKVKWFSIFSDKNFKNKRLSDNLPARSTASKEN